MNSHNQPAGGVLPEEVREAILDAADEWSCYVIEDRASKTLRDHMASALDALPAPVPADPVAAWLPIESAPKDIPVLLMVPTRSSKWIDMFPCLGFWMGGFWVILNSDEAVQRVEPTHWMVPPAAPLHAEGGE